MDLANPLHLDVKGLARVGSEPKRAGHRLRFEGRKTLTASAGGDVAGNDLFDGLRL